MALLRSLLCLVAITYVFGTLIIDEVEVEKSWQHFKKEHNKVYTTIDEENYRRNVFVKSLQEVFEHNLAYDRGDETYFLRINQFSDMPYDEFERNIACEGRSTREASTNSTYNMWETIERLGNPPALKNWETLGFISPVIRDQNYGNCGGCYAFAGVSAIESNFAIKHGLKNKVPNLSEQEVIDCGGKFGLAGCAGGHPCGVYDMAKAYGGLVEESVYPFRQVQHPSGDCKLTKSMKTYGKVVSYSEHNDVTHMDFNLQVLVGLMGPATASVCANDKFKQYGGGVFRDTNCFKECNNQHNRGVTHSVLAIGYDIYNFLLRNSWGTKWGIKGNMLIERVKATKAFGICGLGVDQSHPDIA